MEAICSFSFTFFSSPVLSPPFSSSNQRKAPSLCNFIRASKNEPKFPMIYCKLFESEIAASHCGRGFAIRSSTNKMEEYNTAMKKMMRNPYEYHHDLGDFSISSFFFLPTFPLMILETLEIIQELKS